MSQSSRSKRALTERGPGTRHPAPHALAGLLLGAALVVLGDASVGWSNLPHALLPELGVQVAVGAAVGGVYMGLSAMVGAAGSGPTAALALLLLGWVLGGRLGMAGGPIPGAALSLLGAAVGVIAGQLAGRLPPALGVRQGLAVGLLAWLGLAVPLQLHLLPRLGDELSVAVLGMLGLGCLTIGALVGLLSDDRDAAVPGGAVLLLLASLGAWGARSVSDPAPLSAGQGGPAVLVVLLDGVRADHVAPWASQARETMPGLTAYARGARVYQSAYSTAPWHVPAVGSALTGRTPDQHGAAVNDGGSGEHGQLLLSATTLGESLAQGGFALHVVTADPQLRRWGFARGAASYWDRAEAPANVLLGPLGARGAGGLASVDQVREAGLAALAQSGPQDVVLVHLPYARVPYWPAEEDVVAVGRSGERYPYDVYDATLRGVDRALVALLGAVPERTAVLIAGTHGVNLLESREAAPPAGQLAGANVRVEEVAVPMLWRAPGAGAGLVAGLVSLADVTPTVLHHLGLAALADVAGRALQAPVAERMVESHAVRWGPEEQAVREAKYSLVRTPRGELLVFDRASDPAESKAMAGEAGRELVGRRLAATLAPVGSGVSLRREAPVRARLASWLRAARVGVAMPEAPTP